MSDHVTRIALEHYVTLCDRMLAGDTPWQLSPLEIIAVKEMQNAVRVRLIENAEEVSQK